jgi:MerR family redox-sensitive transcriptional activator SoxR
MVAKKAARPRAQITIGQLAARTGLAVSAIRFYEEKGLVHPGRNAGGQRRFERSDIRRLSFVLIAQQLGFSIAEILDQLERLPSGRTPTHADWQKISEAMRDKLDAKILGLTLLRDKLDGCIGCGCLSLERCAIYNPADKAGLQGVGPRFLVDG